MEQAAFRAYITDAAQIITKNTAAFAGGSYLTARYYDMTHARKDNRTGEEIAMDVIKGAGLEVV